MVDDLLVGGELVEAGVLDGGAIREIVAADRRGTEDRSKEIWQLLTLETWFRQARGTPDSGEPERRKRNDGGDMKQVAQNYKTGELAILDVAAPTCRPGGVLVRTEYSLISSGTEKMKVEESKLSLLGKARARPDQVRKVLDSISQQGLLPTYRKVMNRLDSFTPLGYSLSAWSRRSARGSTS